MRVFRKLYLQLVFILISSLIGLASVPCDESDKTPGIAVVLVDVTGSLNSKEILRVADLSAAVVEKLPCRTKVALFPIHMATQKPSPIITGAVSEDENLNKQAEKPRRIAIQKRIMQLYETINSNKKIVDARTCILDELLFALNYLDGMSEPGDRRMLVIVSDMIEECNMTPLKQPVRLNKHDIRHEIDLARNFKPAENISGIRIVVIQPDNPRPEEVRGERPQSDDLKTFWDLIFIKLFPSSQKRWHIGYVPDRIMPAGKDIDKR